MSTENFEEIEEMESFFDRRAAGYDEHMRTNVFTETEFAHFYQAMSAPIKVTQAPLTILILGCGTGLEIEPLLHRAPNALITGVDVSGKMLEELKKRYQAHLDQITVVVDSYLTIPMKGETFDYVLSAMSVHHLLPDVKRNLYKRIHAALRVGGKYIEGDAVTTIEMEAQFLDEYNRQLGSVPAAEAGHYHIDVPCSLATQRILLRETGFKDFALLWQKDHTATWNAAVYAVTK
ncbi:MAG: class I SAM-dependent methyltransferase [Caldilineaceae bacterium]|nr:class I SAM-dependent methyltransferase [Caldilineaceae bacterium]